MGFFKAYDMRGTFGVDFDLDLVTRVGLSLPRVVKAKRWLVGRDCRTTSEAVSDALVRGLVGAGAEVCDLSLCTTPMVYYFTAADGFGGSVMVTASHNPPTDNGLKVSRATALPVGYADGLDEVERMCARAKVGGRRARPLAASAARLPDALGRYVAWQKSRVDASLFGALSYAVDCSNGMASLLAHELFPGAVIVNDALDGTFPAHSPNPLKADARREIARIVRERGLDCGVVFDGDADRAMFVDERGEFVQSDYLIPVVARATLRAAGGSARGVKVIHDVRTSRGAVETLREDGFDPVMVPVGHAFAKPIL
ncbi:MAG: phosphomannomutase/phosphoglucomutase, partial [Kiritimatiellae bacterium]|nr:phosphomannomutase/phosphoglucomutase [Kiritimatiellia bacterium]